MPAQRTKLYLLVAGLIVCVLSCVFASLSIVKNLGTKNSSEKFPIRTLLIQIDQDQREELISQLRVFSERHHFEFSPSLYENKDVLYVDMEGEALEISALTIPGTPEKIDIAFYEKAPANPPPQETIDELFNELKSLIVEIPNVTILEEK